MSINFSLDDKASNIFFDKMSSDKFLSEDSNAKSNHKEN